MYSKFTFPGRNLKEIILKHSVLNRSTKEKKYEETFISDNNLQEFQQHYLRTVNFSHTAIISLEIIIFNIGNI